MSILLKLKTVALTRLGSAFRQDLIDDATTVETEVNRIATRLDPVIDVAGSITLGGVQRNTWPAASGAAAGLNDILQNGASGDLASGSSAFILRNTGGSLTLLSLDKATGNLTVLGTLSHAAATAAGHGVRADQIQSQSLTRFTTSGSSTAYTLTPSPALAALAVGQRFRMQFHLTAGATPTLAISGLVAKPLKYYNSVGAKVACGAGNIVADMLSDVEYDGTDYVVITPAGIDAATATNSLNSTNVTGSALVSGAIASSSPTAGIGYSDGAGGFVTQASSKTTAVTLNTRCGTIAFAPTTSIGAGVTEEFTFNNTNISESSVIIAHMARFAGNLLNLKVTARNGFATVSLTNPTGSSIGNNLYMNFMIFNSDNT